MKSLIFKRQYHIIVFSSFYRTKYDKIVLVGISVSPWNYCPRVFGGCPWVCLDYTAHWLQRVVIGHLGGWSVGLPRFAWVALGTPGFKSVG